MNRIKTENLYRAKNAEIRRKGYFQRNLQWKWTEAISWLQTRLRISDHMQKLVENCRSKFLINEIAK